MLVKKLHSKDGQIGVNRGGGKKQGKRNERGDLNERIETLTLKIKIKAQKRSQGGAGRDKRRTDKAGVAPSGDQYWPPQLNFLKRKEALDRDREVGRAWAALCFNEDSRDDAIKLHEA